MHQIPNSTENKIKSLTHKINKKQLITPLLEHLQLAVQMARNIAIMSYFTPPKKYFKI